MNACKKQSMLYKFDIWKEKKQTKSSVQQNEYVGLKEQSRLCYRLQNSQNQGFCLNENEHYQDNISKI